jgi:trk system potassium uptake protein TrkA
MNILIAGGGLVGSTLAAKLASDGHDVSVVENNPARVLDLRDTLDCQLIEGNGALPSVLRRAGVKKADLLLATTNADEFNMVVGLLGTAVFNVPRVVVRVREQEHVESFARMSESFPGAHFCVNPAAASVERILSLLDVPGALDVVSFMDGRLLVAGFRILSHSDFAGLLLSHIKLMRADKRKFRSTISSIFRLRGRSSTACSPSWAVRRTRSVISWSRARALSRLMSRGASRTLIRRLSSSRRMWSWPGMPRRFSRKRSLSTGG